MIFSYRATNEIMWAIELRVSFQRYLEAMDITEEGLVEAEWLRRHWVKASMRLGSTDVVAIIYSRRKSAD